MQALAGCVGLTLRAVAKNTPVSLQRIQLKFHLGSDGTKERLGTLIRLTERYCVVYQTLTHSPEIAIRYESR